ncbi:hypothetical protein Daus18300_010325 [Diaporthe australafricana]|uniref:AAA+ ATPase domain-containing protein n=1 Tax=Diaporthe australafricana TaxID=127596 RepID=A0ABR3WAT4_9PEZI
MADSVESKDLTVELMHLKYIELLEKRINQLDVLVNKPADVIPKSRNESATAGSGENDKAKTDESKEEAPKLPSRYRNILRKWDKTSGDYKEEVVEAGRFDKPTRKEFAYSFRRTYNPEKGDKDAFSDIEIEDDKLIELLKKVIGKYPGLNYDTDMLTMTSPFPAIIHHWNKLRNRVQQSPEEQVCKDLSNLMNRVKNSRELEAYFKIRDSSSDTKVVTFDTLWTAFAPGKLIVTRPFMADVPQITMVQDSPMPWTRNFQSTRPLSMWAWTWDWDGRQLLKVEHEFQIEWFRGTRKVTELSEVPLEMYDKAEELKEKVRERSRKFFKYTKGVQSNSNTEAELDQVLYYDNLGWADERKTLAEDDGNTNPDNYNDIDGHVDDEDSAGNLVTIKGDFISDAAEYSANSSYKNFPIGPVGRHIYVQETQLAPDEGIEFRELVDKIHEEDPKFEKPLDPNNDNFLVTPPRLLGYATRQRIWGQICLDWAEPKKKADQQVFLEKLQLNSRDKNMILSLVVAHMKTKEKKVKDIVENKGKGLVLLLHGPPGVGKTLTAETVAKATGRPLFVVSVAEIGLDASRAERKLEKVFALATKWQAVLLVDEADVFLETRSKNSPASRNALVSVLLRVLEYYEGIIIMTTNRIRAIDVAVISRIHLAVRYDDLSSEQRASIFAYYLDQLQDEVPTLITEQDREEIDDFIEVHGDTYLFNGRQIRNVVQAAHAYAAHGFSEEQLIKMTGDEEPLGERRAERRGRRSRARVQAARRSDGRMTQSHLKAVCDMTRSFQEQLKEESNSQRSENEALRGSK